MRSTCFGAISGRSSIFTGPDSSSSVRYCFSTAKASCVSVRENRSAIRAMSLGMVSSGGFANGGVLQLAPVAVKRGEMSLLEIFGSVGAEECRQQADVVGCDI